MLVEISRVMKPTAFLAISVWPGLVEPETEREIKSADFRLEKEIPEGFSKNGKSLGTRRILKFRKERHVLTIIN